MIERIKEKENLEEKRCIENYLAILEKSCKDFLDVKSAYEKACSELRKKFKYTDRIIEYTNDMLLLNLRYSFNQGFKDGINYFADPQAPTFLDVDYDAALREKEVYSREEYVDLFEKRKQLISLMSDEVFNIFNAVIEYEEFLYTYIPKMAHYYGFLDFNNIMKKSNADYKPEYKLLNRYKDWLSTYLNLSLE